VYRLSGATFNGSSNILTGSYVTCFISNATTTSYEIWLQNSTGTNQNFNWSLTLLSSMPY
jgi:hypothetical protein